MKRPIFFLWTMAFLTYSSMVFCEIIRVPDDFQTIQAAIDTAVDGDSILVAPGTFVKNINFLGKAVTVKSENGPDVTIIDGGNPTHPDTGSVVRFQSGEGSASVLDGFTLTNGTGTLYPNGDYTGGGGIFCNQSSSPTIINNIITKNEANSGGGITCNNHASPTITGNTITGNTTDNHGGGIACISVSAPAVSGNTIVGNTTLNGGGIYCYYARPDIAGNVITSNMATGNGGGFSITANSSAVVEGNTITGNTAENGGGGYCVSSPSDIINNYITGNNAVYLGGGLYGSGGWIYTPTFQGNFITLNSSGWYGGGVYCDLLSAIIDRNTIAGNSADLDGGGIYSYRSASGIRNSTIIGNTAGFWGGGVYYRDCATTISNAIIWANKAQSGQQIRIGDVSQPSDITVTHSDVEGGDDSVYVEPGSTLDWGPGVMDAAPLFVDPWSDDFSLLTDSPCIDSGDPDSEIPENGGDRVDMGANEYQYPEFSCLQLAFENTPPVGMLGETVIWDFTVANPCTDYMAFDGWVVVSGPANSIRDSILNITIPPSSIISGNVYLYVPYGAPLGLYTAKGRVGIMHQEIWDGEVFNGEVVEKFHGNPARFIEDNWRIKLAF